MNSKLIDEAVGCIDQGAGREYMLGEQPVHQRVPLPVIWRQRIVTNFMKRPGYDSGPVAPSAWKSGKFIGNNDKVFKAVVQICQRAIQLRGPLLVVIVRHDLRHTVDQKPAQMQ
ncbi:hypothetical protein WS86_15255 [Burkholderia savannae]|uniref:hypothetical protein n=1 Tax=Burkholderia savannae TaxID=1637837 RepID=UPI00075B8157|nr:hypothetical protein [Burkholderia savannae]AOJ81833.1 hypothetical protein WS86_15255 [Burkholderia savannae]